MTRHALLLALPLLLVGCPEKEVDDLIDEEQDDDGGGVAPRPPAPAAPPAAIARLSDPRSPRTG